MSKESFVVGLDIGTSKIKALILKRDSRGELELVRIFGENSLGVRKGTVEEPEKTSNIIRDLFLKINEELDEEFDSVFVNLSGSHLFAKDSHGLVSVSRADRKISKEDIARVLDAAQIINLPSNNKIFDVRPKSFSVDERKDIKDPYGLDGVRLEVDVLALGGFSPYILNTEKAIEGAGLEVTESVPSPLAAARAVLTEDQKQLGCAVLDIGAGISTMAVFKNSHLIYFSVLPIGSDDITSDIAVGLKISPEMAEKIKLEYGSCSLKGKDVKRKINIGEEEPLEFSQKLLVKIISSRVSEIFEEANKEMKKVIQGKSLPSGIVLTGGGAKLSGILRLAKKDFCLYASLGVFHGPLKAEDDLSLATAYGLALLGVDSLENHGSGPNVLKWVWQKTKSFVKLFNP